MKIDVESAIIGLDGLRKILSPLLLKLNHEGLGATDVEEFEDCLILAVYAMRHYNSLEAQKNHISRALTREREYTKELALLLDYALKDMKEAANSPELGICAACLHSLESFEAPYCARCIKGNQFKWKRED